MRDDDNRTCRSGVAREAAMLNYSRAAIGCIEDDAAGFGLSSGSGLSACEVGLPLLGLSAGPVSSAHTKRLMERVVSQGGVLLTGGRRFATAAALAACIGVAGAQYAQGADITVSGAGNSSSGIILGSTRPDSTMDVLDSGTAISTTISLGGEQYVYNNGTASSTIISAGGLQYVSLGGSAISTNISSGGLQNVTNYGSAISTNISSGGQQDVNNYGSAIQYHFIWVTNYRKPILNGEVSSSVG